MTPCRAFYASFSPCRSNGTRGMSIVEWLARCADARASDQSIPLGALCRQIVAHSEWYADVDEHGELVDSRVYCGTAAPSESMLQPVNGIALAAAAAQTPSIRFHYEADVAPLVLDATETSLLATYVQSAVVEALLQRLHDGSPLEVSEPFSRLRTGAFFVLCAQATGDSDSLRMALVPDVDGGRRLVAAFTTQDALQAFVAAASKPSEHVSMRLAGQELFQYLLDQGTMLDGVVFNPAGPTQPIAFANEVARVVCDMGRA